MSKPMKKGLDYFPLDTCFLRDPKIQRLLLEFGCEGLSVFMAVLCEVYASQGYYVAVRSGFYADVGFALGIETGKVKQIVECCVTLDLLDNALYEQWGILTSYGVQQRYQVIRKKGNNRIKSEYLILRDEDFSDPENEDYINVNKNIDEKIKESKEKESKEKESKEKKSKEEKSKENGNSEKTEINYGKKSATNNTDEARRAELLRMAAIATGNGGHV